ncbi:MAG: HNH endonuclease [Mucilaginibacter sp.]
MKAGQTLWTKDELILAINLYSKITFGQMNSSNPQVKELAGFIGRSVGAVVRKLGNFASFDPLLKARGIKGLSNASKLDETVWNEYMQNWGELFFEGEKLLAKKQDTTVEKLYNINLDEYKHTDGREIQRLVKVRVNQSAFRGAVLTNFNNQCCITGIGITELIVASHIVPWSMDKDNRLSPMNGLALNALHDKAFDKHLITVTEDFKVKISPTFYKHKDVESIKQNFIDYDGMPLKPYKKYSPNPEFLRIHNDRFAG